MPSQVNARALLIKNKSFGMDLLVDAILSEEINDEKVLYSQAKQINESNLQRTYVEACLLASEDYKRIGEILDLSPGLIEFYSMIYYDVKGLNRLSKMELLEVKDQQEMMMKLWSLHQGLSFIEWRLGGVTKINPIDGLKELFSMSLWKARESLFSSNASAASQEGLKWSKITADLARLLKAYTTDDEAARQELIMALQNVVPEFKGFGDLE